MAFPGVASRGVDVIRTLSKIASLRTIQVTVVPTPVKLTERRAVLNALQQLVKVEVFRKLEDHDASFVSVLNKPESVQELLSRTPLEFHLVTDKPSNGVMSFLTSAPSTNAIIDSKSNPSGNSNDMPSQDSAEARNPADKVERRRFTVHIFPMREYVHASAIRASPLHGPWPEPRAKIEMGRILKKSMRNDIAADGLSDWETGGQVPDVARTKKLEDLLFGHASMDVVKRAVEERKKRAEIKRSRPAVMDGLLHLRHGSPSNTQGETTKAPQAPAT